MKMFVIDKNGGLHLHASFDNSFRGWFIYWDFLAKKYFPGQHVLELCITDESEFWDLITRDDIPLHERMAFYITFDNIIIKKSDFDLVASAIEHVITEMLDAGHWESIMRKFYEAIDDDHVIGACFRANEYVHAWGNNGSVLGRNGKTRPFNIFKDDCGQYILDFNRIGRDRLKNFKNGITNAEKQAIVQGA